MYRRRFYYDLTTGEMLRSYTAQGKLKIAYTAAEEAAQLGLTNWGVMEWTEPDAAIDAAFAGVDAEGNARSVTVTVVDGALHFEYTAIPAQDDPYAIIDVLTGEA